MTLTFSPHTKKILGIAFLVAVIGLIVRLLNHANARDAFIGDSLTQQWNFPRHNYGHFGETSSQVLNRFQRQIGPHHYRKVFILAGTNDVLLGIDPDVTLSNLGTMVTLAQRDGAEPVLGEIPPIYSKDGRYVPAVNALNERIVQLASTRGLKLADYSNAMRGHTGDYYLDGVHFKRFAYLRMEWALLKVTDPF